MLTLTTLLFLAATAHADIMWEPTDNSFYDNHRDECEYENRSYYANGKDGFVTMWDAPDGSTVRAQYENGETLWVSHIYKNWALINRWEGGNETSGWVPVTDLYLVYDHISFEEEYGSQFKDYNGEFADYSGEVRKSFWFWEYPNTREPREKHGISQDMLDALRGTAEQPSYISKIYVDENNRTWGFVNYMYGIRNFWILLDNPTGDGVITASVPEWEDLVTTGELTAPQEPVPPTMTARSLLPYILVGAVVVVTAGILIYFYGKRKKSTD